jgi:hypothetical protein
MGEHAERDDPGEDATRAMPPASRPRSRQRRRTDWHQVKDRIVDLLAAFVRGLGLIFAVVLVLHVVFVIGEANAANGIVSFISDAADTVSIGFHDLFTPVDPKLSVLVNYGIAALFWLVVSSVVARIIRRVGGVDQLRPG